MRQGAAVRAHLVVLRGCCLFCLAVRRSLSAMHTLCWLPRSLHMAILARCCWCPFACCATALYLRTLLHMACCVLLAICSTCLCEDGRQQAQAL